MQGKSSPAFWEGFIGTQLVQAEAERDQLRRLETDLTTSLAIEQNRWADFNSRLDELERALAR